MKFTVFIDKDREEEIIIYARERSGLIDKIEKLVADNSEEIIGYKNSTAEILDPADIFCFTAENGKVFAVTEKEKFRIKERLYSLEEKLGSDFIRINQSCIANIRKIKCFESSVYGSLGVTFKNGAKDYVSRRNLKAVKERLGI